MKNRLKINIGIGSVLYLALSLSYASFLDSSVLDKNQKIFQDKPNGIVHVIKHGEINSIKQFNPQISKVANQINESRKDLSLSTVKIDLWQYNNAPHTSFSNARNDCTINMVYRSKAQPFVLKNVHEDFNFVVWHEIGHCVLGKEIFKRMEWETKISTEQKKSLEYIIQQKTNKIIKIKKTEHANALPIVVFHEMFADIFSVLWLYMHNELKTEQIKEIIQEREALYKLNSYTSHISSNALKEVVTILHKQSLSHLSDKEIVKISKMIAEKHFIQYLLIN